jgi:competence protein ComEC
VIWIPLALLSVTALRPRDRVTILDIGQGDAVFLESRGHAMLFDSGCPGYEGRPADAPPAVTARRVRPLDLLALSHGHADHTGGAGELMEAGRVRSLWMRKPPRDAGLARQAACAQRLGIPVRPPGDPGDPVSIVLGGAVRIASPWDGEPPAETSENDRSLSVRFEAGALAVVLLGDAGHPTEHALLARRDAVREIAAPAPVLLSPHHGSRDSASPELLDAVRPRLVMFSCGSGNPHGHPHAETIARARERGCALLRTDRDGSIALTRTRIGFRIRWTRDFPGPRALLPPIPLPSPGPIS